MNDPLAIKKIAMIVLSALLIFTLGYVIITMGNRAGKTPVHISSFPNDAAITIDGESIKNGTHYLSPGTYIVEASKNGYDPYSKTLVLENTEQDVAIILTPNTEETLKIAKENEREYEKVFAKAQEAAAEMGKTFNERNPIAKHLPYKTFFYSIGYRMDPTDSSGNSIIIEIDAPEGYRQSALYRIRQLGYDPTDFTINFRGYENPFAL